MRGRAAPTDENGLVRRPEFTFCIGKACPAVETTGRCFKDEHHLYWPRIMYMGESALAFTFRSDPLNIVSIARCRHSSAWSRNLHNRYAYAPIPEEDRMATFLDESRMLRSCNATAVGLVHKIRQIEKDKRILENVRASVQDAFDEKYEAFLDIAGKVLDISVVPIDVVKETILPNVQILLRRYPETDIGALAILAA